MKTAISVPDDTYERATERARELGMSRSEFFARAAERYLDALDAATVTAQIDEALGSIRGEDASAAEAVAAGRRVLNEAAGEW